VSTAISLLILRRIRLYHCLIIWPDSPFDWIIISFRARLSYLQAEGYQSSHEMREDRKKGSVLKVSLNITIFFFVLYSTLLHLPPLRFHCADGCWDRTQDSCNWCIGSQTLTIARLSQLPLIKDTKIIVDSGVSIKSYSYPEEVVMIFFTDAQHRNVSADPATLPLILFLFLYGLNNGLTFSNTPHICMLGITYCF